MLVEVLQALEIGGKGAVELVEMAFVLDQDGTGQEIEFVHVGKHHMVLERIVQVEQFADRHRHLGRAHFIEQVEQHGRAPERVIDCHRARRLAWTARCEG